MPDGWRYSSHWFVCSRYVPEAIKDGNPILQLYFIEKLHLDGNPGAFFMLFPVIILHSFKVFRKC